ncbi:Response regulator protein TodT [Symmachiella macrocystis]|uniref:Response regulator protein TodT n=1 Tax=Symmachiella macrocystis TaxID=2527985 RepID=A0A5C6B618_9PLAN|nr:LuxR C-terminal-related transcriptional regulator [Symmachiella macrocystis]TWU06951.1 Response regulator protein TodT [Symmachiella macrocystis]
MRDRTTVILVDNDETTTESLSKLVARMGFRCQCYHSGLEFLENYDCEIPSVIVSELRTADVSGLQIQRILKDRGCQVPIIFLTHYGSIPLAAKTLRSGAVHFLEKPVNEQEFWDAVLEAVAVADRWNNNRLHAEEIRQRMESLTEQELEVLQMIGDGEPNKSIAAALGVSVRTVEIRRSSMMVKLNAKTITDLIRFTLRDTNGHSDSFVGGLVPNHLSLSARDTNYNNGVRLQSELDN